MQKVVIPKQTLVDLWIEKEMSIEAISRELKNSVKTVKRNINEYGLEQNKPYQTYEWLYQKHYIEKLSGVQMAKIAGISKTQLYFWMKRNGIAYDRQISNDSKKKYTENIYHFDTIDSEEKAYWLGFLMADGCIRKYILQLSLGRIDRDHLQKFLNALHSDRNIYDYEQVFAEGGKIHQMSRIRVNSVHIIRKLRSYGFEEQKSMKEALPDLRPDLTRHFIRGYFDGDGCFTHGIRKRGGEYCSAKILGGKDFLKKIAKIINRNNISLNFRQKKDDLYEVSMSHNQAVEFLNYIYQDATIYLERKFKKFQNYLNGGKPRNRLEVRKEEMLPVYELIWEFKQTGMTHQAIADGLNKKDIQTLKRTPYSEGAVRRALKKRQELIANGMGTK